MGYQLIIPAIIESRLYDYALYIARDSPLRAVAWVDDVTEHLRMMADMPRAYSVAEEESSILGHEVRKMVIGSYLAFYQIDDDAKRVVLVDIRHGAQQPRREQE